MNAESLELISIIAFACAALLGIVAIVMFFKLNIRAIVDDLSGKKAERQIRELREQNRVAKGRAKIPLELVSRSAYRTERQGTTSSRLRNETTASLKQTTEPLREGTVLLTEETASLNEGTVLLTEETASLNEGTVLLTEETVFLDEATTLLSDETTLLDEGTTLLDGGTTLLDEGTAVLDDEEVTLENGYRLLLEEIVVHTHEGV